MARSALPVRSPSSRLSVVVLSGCPAVGVRKHARFDIALSAVTGIGVRAFGPGGLWLAGNRRTVPTLVVGQTLALNDGDSMHRVVVEILAVAS